MATKREEAQKRRAEERQKRRANGPKASEEPKQEETSGEEPLDTVKHAAKVAAAAAAVGAAMGAARAMTGSHDGDGPGHEPEPEPKPEPEASSEPASEPEQPEEREEPEPEPRAEREEPREEPEPEQRPSGAKPNETRRVVETAREQLAALLGKEPDSVSGLDRNGDGWIVTLEVVELPRIPESTDVLASYEVELDGDRNLVRYARGRRYYRSQAGDEES